MTTTMNAVFLSSANTNCLRAYSLAARCGRPLGHSPSHYLCASHSISFPPPFAESLTKTTTASTSFSTLTSWTISFFFPPDQPFYILPSFLYRTCSEREEKCLDHLLPMSSVPVAAYFPMPFSPYFIRERRNSLRLTAWMIYLFIYPVPATIYAPMPFVWNILSTEWKSLPATSLDTLLVIAVASADVYPSTPFRQSF